MSSDIRPEFTVQQAAEIKKVTHKTIRRAIARGDLIAYRLPGSHLIRIRAEDLDNFGRRIPSAKAGKK